ncbi:glycosyltransferase [Streptococcus porcinus]
MNILIITQLYPQPDDIGDNKPTKTVKYFADVWKNEGHNVTIVHCSSKFPFIFYLIPPKLKDYLAGKTSNIFPSISSRKKIHRVENGINIVRLPLLKSLPGKGYTNSYLKKNSREIKQILDNQKFKPDIVMGHFANPSTELVSLLSKDYDCMSSIVFHGDCTETTLEKYKIQKNIKNIKAIGTRSRVESKKVKELLNLNSDPFICYSGVPDNSVRKIQPILESSIDNKGLRYLFVGSLIRRKNLIEVIDAFTEQAEENDELIIIGGGSEEKRIKSYIKNSKHSDKVRMLGRISREEVMNYMNSSDVFTLISSNEVFGMVYIEAMLNGCITIASKNGGADGIIENGKNGFLCEQGNSKMLSSIFADIKKLQVQEKLLIRRNAQETAKRFSETEVAENYLKEVLKRNEENYENTVC